MILLVITVPEDLDVIQKVHLNTIVRFYQNKRTVSSQLQQYVGKNSKMAGIAEI